MKTLTANAMLSRFELNESALREALEDQRWIIPFAPLRPDADELHHLVAQCEERGIISPPSEGAGIAIYPAAIASPEPQLAVDPGFGGPLLLGGDVAFQRGLVSDVIQGSFAVICDLVQQANRILEQAAQAYEGRFADGD